MAIGGLWIQGQKRKGWKESSHSILWFSLASFFSASSLPFLFLSFFCLILSSLGFLCFWLPRKITASDNYDVFTHRERFVFPTGRKRSLSLVLTTPMGLPDVASPPTIGPPEQLFTDLDKDEKRLDHYITYS